MHRVIVVGSPRTEGRSAALADELFQACIEECPEDGVSIVSVASVDVAPCVGCDACQAQGEPAVAPEEGDPLEPCESISASDACAHACVIEDDMAEVRKHLDAADELIVVCPVYFAGAPSQMKALMDRLQPYFWSDARRQPKRPCVLHVVGEGGDPHGFEPLISTVRSAFSVAGFQLDLVLDWVGKIDSSGEILADAVEYPLPPVGGFGGSVQDDRAAFNTQADTSDSADGEEALRDNHAAQAQQARQGRQDRQALQTQQTQQAQQTQQTQQAQPRRSAERPKLDLSAAAPASKSQGKSKSKSKGKTQGKNRKVDRKRD